MSTRRGSAEEHEGPSDHHQQQEEEEYWPAYDPSESAAANQAEDNDDGDGEGEDDDGGEQQETQTSDTELSAAATASISNSKLSAAEERKRWPAYFGDMKTVWDKKKSPVWLTPKIVTALARFKQTFDRYNSDVHLMIRCEFQTSTEELYTRLNMDKIQPEFRQMFVQHFLGVEEGGEDEDDEDDANNRRCSKKRRKKGLQFPPAYPLWAICKILQQSNHSPNNPSRWFAAFTKPAVRDITLIIVGKDPYPSPHVADGFCFSAYPTNKGPGSLYTLRRCLENFNRQPFTYNNINRWTSQGAFMINTVLTCQHNHPGSHSMKGCCNSGGKLSPELASITPPLYELVVLKAMKRVLQLTDRKLVIVTFGADAKKCIAPLAKAYGKYHTFLDFIHPSPLAAGSFTELKNHPLCKVDVFGDINRALEANGSPPITWCA